MTWFVWCCAAFIGLCWKLQGLCWFTMIYCFCLTACFVLLPASWITQVQHCGGGTRVQPRNLPEPHSLLSTLLQKGWATFWMPFFSKWDFTLKYCIATACQMFSKQLQSGPIDFHWWIWQVAHLGKCDMLARLRHSPLSEASWPQKGKHTSAAAMSHGSIACFYCTPNHPC